MPTAATKTIDIHVTTRQDLEQGLEAAVHDLQKVAMRTGDQGILITRHAPGSYTAQLSENVPYGTTLEFIHR